MEYSFPEIGPNYIISDSGSFYETDLVNQWLNVQRGSVLDSVNCGKITVINAGKLNRHEGPDIKDAILIINNKIVCGPIECHRTPSDWVYHGHFNNPNYDNVILHIVSKVNRSKLFPPLPTLVLNSKHNKISKCSLNTNNQSIELNKLILIYSHKRWIEKIGIYDGCQNDRSKVIRQLMVNSFKILGSGGNKKQFEQLALSLKIDDIQDLGANQIEEVLWSVSDKLKIKWVKRGIRPAQHPHNRMILAAEMVKYFLELDINHLPKLSDIKKHVMQKCPSASGRCIRTEVLGNVLIPFYGTRAFYFQKIDIYQKYSEDWFELRIPFIYQKYAKRFGALFPSEKLKTFSILQGLIEIDRNWCSKNICHLCPLKKKKYANR